MRYVKPITFTLLLVSCVSRSQDAEVAPTRLEAFVANQFVVVEQEEQIGELGSLDSFVRINAIEANDRSNPGMVVRGVRIDLSNNAWHDSVYLDQEQFTELSRQLRLMQNMLELNEDESSPFFRPRTNSGQTTMGSEICWLPEVPQRILCPSQHFDQGRQSFTLQVFGSQESFPLNADQLVALSRMVDSAIERLESNSLFVSDRGVVEDPSSDEDLIDSPAILVRSFGDERSTAQAEPTSQAFPASRETSRGIILPAIAVLALLSVLAAAGFIVSRRVKHSD